MKFTYREQQEIKQRIAWLREYARRQWKIRRAKDKPSVGDRA